MKSGITLCISSQIGCKMGCTFCETGRMGLLKNLSSNEIVSQVFIAQFHLDVRYKVRNIVFMQRLRGLGYQVLYRHHKGRAIMAACGQLGKTRDT